MMIPVGSAYGHGLGIDIIEQVKIGEKTVTITVQITPTIFDEKAEKKITVTATDARTGQNLNDVVFFIGLYHAGTQIFEDGFFADDGIVSIDVNTIEGQTEIVGEYDIHLDAWYETESAPIKLVGPAFDTGGLYHFEIAVKRIGEQAIENPATYVADATMVTSQHYEKKDADGRDVTFRVTSYYDRVSGFDYDPLTGTMTLEMPFDWSEQNISHVPVVHEEVHFPKSLEGLFVPSYNGMANGIDLFRSSVMIDDYSDEDERTIHFVITQNQLRYLKQAQKTAGIDNPQNITFTLNVSDRIVFPVVAMTKNEEIQVDLSWDPVTIEPEKNTRFVFTFRDATTGDTIRDMPYDFVLLQDGEVVHKKSGTARIGGDYVDYVFTQGQTGQTAVRFENLGPDKLSTEFGIVVVPEFGSLVFAVLSASIMLALVINRKAVLKI